MPVDPGVTNRPIRFELTARTDDPKHLANSLVIPDRGMYTNEKLMVSPDAMASSKRRPCAPMVHCGLHALEVRNLNVVANKIC